MPGPVLGVYPLTIPTATLVSRSILHPTLKMGKLRLTEVKGFDSRQLDDE